MNLKLPKAIVSPLREDTIASTLSASKLAESFTGTPSTILVSLAGPKWPVEVFYDNRII